MRKRRVLKKYYREEGLGNENGEAVSGGVLAGMGSDSGVVLVLSERLGLG